VRVCPCGQRVTLGTCSVKHQLEGAFVPKAANKLKTCSPHNAVSHNSPPQPVSGNLTAAVR
jgi:hypothetical protein